MTLFQRHGDDCESWCARILDAVDDHLGDAMHRDGYAILAVYGTPLSGHLRHALFAFGFSEFVSTTEGFRAIKRDTGRIAGGWQRPPFNRRST
ncbi:TPA: hypothetical protein ACUNF5_003016 [Burkholderia orbicola]|uniref:hypothetical protein n=1 Tax=Burkholderia cenocepacia TaxID=95486 RepID=UPI000F5B27CA|nr:hypothetical protein [Burkholderia cenocepacia]